MECDEKKSDRIMYGLELVGWLDERMKVDG